MHAGGLVIQVYKTGRNTGNSTFQLRRLLNIADRIKHYLLDRHKFFTGTPLQNIEQLFLCFLQDSLCAVFFQIAGILHLFIGFDQTSENRFLTDDICIIFNIRRGRYCSQKITHIFHAADIRRQFFFLKTILQGDQIYRLSFIAKFYHCIKNNPILLLIKIIACQDLRGNQDRIPVKDHGADH